MDSGRPTPGPRFGATSSTLASGVGLAIGSFAPLDAQALPDPASPGPSTELVAYVGIFYTLANLTLDPASFGTVIDPDVALGASAVIWTSDRFGFGVTGLFSPANLTAIGAQFQGATPSDLGSATYLAGAVNALYRVPVSGTATTVEPYFALGAGLKHLSLDEIAAPEAESATDPLVTGAIGVRIGILGNLLMRAEVRDFASLYESPTTGDSRVQHDLAVTVGFGTRIH
jgi:hypothetical protein